MRTREYPRNSDGSIKSPTVFQNVDGEQASHFFWWRRITKGTEEYAMDDDEFAKFAWDRVWKMQELR
jgi:hypothetical protein